MGKHVEPERGPSHINLATTDDDSDMDVEITDEDKCCVCQMRSAIVHYENMPMQYTEIFIGVKNENFQHIFFFIFLIFAQNIDCGYTLEPPRRGGSNEYP